MTQTALAMRGSFGRKINGTSAPAFDGSQPCVKLELSLFFPDDRVSELKVKSELKPVCNKCQFQSACLEWAIENRERGIWAGTTEEERRLILRRRNRARG